MELIFEDSGFIVKTLSAHEELEAAWALRHEVFANELGWVPPNPRRIETDRYDGFSESIGVFGPGMELAGSLRIIRPPDPFMIDREFARLMPEGASIERTQDVAEITRLCVDKRHRLRGTPGVTPLLYKGLYHWNLRSGVRFSAMVVDDRCHRVLRLACLPVEPLGKFVEMPDGVKAAVCMLDWHRFDAEASARRPEYHAWMSTLQGRCQGLSLSHAPC